MAAASRRIIAWVLYLVTASFICLVKRWLFKLWPVQAPLDAFRQYPPCPVLVGIMQGRGSVIPLQQTAPELLIVNKEIFIIDRVRDDIEYERSREHYREDQSFKCALFEQLGYCHVREDRE